MSRDQYTLTDPTKLYADIETKAQSQKGPGLMPTSRSMPTMASRPTAALAD